MTDTIHEFYSNKGITYSDMANGIVIASTTGSQTAVIRDVAIKTTASKKVSLSVDDIEIASTSTTETLSGTELLKASQEIKMKPGQDLAWTGMICNNQGNHTTQTQYWEIKSTQFFDPPVDHEDATEYGLLDYSSFADRQGTWRSGGGAIPSASTFSNGITCWPAGNMFGKDAYDLYFSRYAYYAQANSGANKLWFYDDSAGSSTEVVGEKSDRKGWQSGVSNRYLVRPYETGGTMSKFDIYDTHTNTYTSDKMVKNYNGSGNDVMNNYSNEQSQISIMDNYMFTKNLSASSGNQCALTDITTGNTIEWSHHNAQGTSFCAQSSSYRNRPSYAQIVKNTNGNYYVLWMFVEGSDTQETESGVQIIDLGANPGSLISGNKGGSNYPSLAAKWNDTNVDWFRWRLHEGTTSYRYGWTSGFHPMKRITPTDSGCRYWMLKTYYGTWIMDLDTITGTGRVGTDSGVTVKRLQWKHNGGSTSNNPSNFQTDWKIGTLFLDYDGTAASSSYGTFDVRVTGILST